MLSTLRCSSTRRVLASPAHIQCFRAYAAEAAQKKPSLNKGSATSTSHSATTGAIPVNVGKHAPSPTARKKKAVARLGSASTPVGSQQASKSAGPAHVETPPVEKPAEVNTELTAAEQMAQLDKLILLQRMYPGADIWGQKMETLDVQLPYSTKFRDRACYPTWRAMRQQLYSNIENGLKSAVSLYRLAFVNGIPGLDLEYPKFAQKYFKWPLASLKYRSTNPDAWIAPFRSIALDTYKSLNTAVAQGDSKVVKRYTTDVYQESMSKLIKSRGQHHKCIWRYHKEVSPPRVLSFRATEGFLGTEEPKIGNRMLVQALVRFDSEQSVEIYDKYGTPLHKQARTEVKRVTEYLVFEKRMWYDTPWVIREQMYEGIGKAPIRI